MTPTLSEYSGEDENKNIGHIKVKTTRREIQKKARKCEICGGGGNYENHHISYYPEVVVELCEKCHNKVHNEDGFYDALKPDMERPKTYQTGQKSAGVDDFLKTCRKDGSICELVSVESGYIDKVCIYCKRYFNDDGELANVTKHPYMKVDDGVPSQKGEK